LIGCGAGGAQIFMDKPARINVIRLKELDAAGAPLIATACPHCLTMLESARAQSQGEGAPVADIAEIAAARLAGD
ncbi:MAG: hypothetical protein HUK26_09715, partial [Duodenibacillus sp.]|nr:hypothetical protein [Duodenibacillus sp.]